MDFSNLKMLGHVFVVDDAKDLAQIVRDASRYGGSYRPEVRRPPAVSRTELMKSRMCMSLFKGGLIGRRSRRLSIKRCII